MSTGSRLGADPSSLRAARTTLLLASAQVGRLAAEADHSVTAVRWTGGDAEELQLAWRAVRRTFEEVRVAAAAAARTLEGHAEEQDVASVGA
jgi:hypothetical protein